MTLKSARMTLLFNSQKWYKPAYYYHIQLTLIIYVFEVVVVWKVSFKQTDQYLSTVSGTT